VPGNVANALDIRHGRAAELHDHQRHANPIRIPHRPGGRAKPISDLSRDH
jgi:hypothetical protein